MEGVPGGAEGAELDEVAGGSMRAIVQRLVQAVDPDEQAKAVAGRPARCRAEHAEDLLEPVS